MTYGLLALICCSALGACLLRPPAARRIITLVVQTFALLGTLVGGFTIVVGIGPQTMADHIFHLFLVVVVLAGLVVIFKGPKEIGREQPLADRPTA
jgi:peptidoglycan/LPS O-acetylase OafA/YrhL